MKTQENYNQILNEIPFEALKNWCDENLNVAQRKLIFRGCKRYGHLNKIKACFLYHLDGTFIDKFESREDCGEQIKILTGQSSVGYISKCLRSKTPVYRRFWVTESFPFDKEIYNDHFSNKSKRKQ